VCGHVERGALPRRVTTETELVQDACGDLVLNGEDVRELTLESLRPYLVAVPGVHELRRDTHAIACLTYAPLENRSNAQPSADLGDLEIFALKGERRRSRDHMHPMDARQRVDDLLRNPVAEVLLVLARTHIDERQHGNRRREATLGRRRRQRHGRRQRDVHGSQILQNLGRRAITSIRVFLEGFIDDDLERTWQRGLQGEKRGLRPVQEVIEDCCSRIALKRRSPSRHFEKHDSQRKQVRARIDRPPERLLWRHIARRSNRMSFGALIF
jgi:hypothetical protein